MLIAALPSSQSVSHALCIVQKEADQQQSHEIETNVIHNIIITLSCVQKCTKIFHKQPTGLNPVGTWPIKYLPSVELSIWCGEDWPDRRLVTLRLWSEKCCCGYCTEFLIIHIKTLGCSRLCLQSLPHLVCTSMWTHDGILPSLKSIILCPFFTYVYSWNLTSIMLIKIHQWELFVCPGHSLLRKWCSVPSYYIQTTLSVSLLSALLHYYYLELGSRLFALTSTYIPTVLLTFYIYLLCMYFDRVTVTVTKVVLSLRHSRRDPDIGHWIQRTACY